MIRAALDPDKATLQSFIGAMFRHADKDTFISLRAFEDGKREQPPLFIDGVKVGRPELLDWTFNRARQAARHEKTANFCPPVATFDDQKKAEEKNIANGLGLSVECDEAPAKARVTLTSILGEPTVVCASGGEWTDPATGEVEPKIHLHWRLTEPTREAADHAKLKRARKLACTLVGADATGVPINHPFRWPGSVHRKGEPKLARILAETENEIELADALEKLEIACPDVQPDRARSFGEFADQATQDALRGDLVDIASALAVIPNGDEKWVHWNHIGMATWRASDGRAFAAFDAWSQKSSKYDAGATAARWDHYSTSPPTEVGAGTLYRLARKVMPTWRRPTLIARDAERATGETDQAERMHDRFHDDRWNEYDFGPSPGAEEKGPTGPARKPIRASAFQWRDPKTIPLRPWLYGTVYLREVITVTAGPGGYGKSSLVLVEAVAMASGRALLGIQVAEPLRVWYVNLEDGREELERRVMAICLHFGVTEGDLAGRLFLDSGDDCRMVVVTETKDGARVAEPVVAEVAAEIAAHKIDVLMVDPFVSAHEVNENDNARINVVKNTFAGIARNTKVAVGLVHHVRKGVSGQGAFTIDDSRGAKALIDGARIGRILNGMSAEDGEKAGVANPRVYFYMTTGKANLAPASDRREWYHIRSVSLGNGEPPFGPNSLPIDTSDHVGVVETWEWPDPQANITTQHLRDVQTAMAGGRFRENHQAKDWIGHVVARVLKLDPANRAHKRIILANIKIWLGSGALVIVTGKDEKAKDRPYVEVGRFASDDGD